MKFGLKHEIIDKIIVVFKSNQLIDQAIIYGSRAKGDFKYYSDIDIVLKGENLDHDALTNLTMKLDDLMLPWGKLTSQLCIK